MQEGILFSEESGWKGSCCLLRAPGQQTKNYLVMEREGGVSGALGG